MMGRIGTRAPCVHALVYALGASKLIMKYRPAIGMDHHCSRARVCHVRDLPGHPVVPARGGSSVMHTRDRGDPPASEATAGAEMRGRESAQKYQ
jgi:hypothetical protein